MVKPIAVFYSVIYMSFSFRIRGWWVLHHYLSVFLSAILLIWPESVTYQLFRNKFMAFSLYLCKYTAGDYPNIRLCVRSTICEGRGLKLRPKLFVCLSIEAPEKVIRSVGRIFFSFSFFFKEKNVWKQIQQR